MRLIDADALKSSWPYEPAIVERVIDAAPTIDAIPVAWLKAQIRSYTGDASDIGKSARNGTIKDLIRKWHHEQEAR